MPHCIIEYSADIKLSASDLIEAVYEGSVSSQLFENDHIKTRSIAYQDYLKGDKREHIIHISARILSGRTAEQRKLLSQMILNTVTKLAESQRLEAITITVEVIEMERQSYSKKEI